MAERLDYREIDRTILAALGWPSKGYLALVGAMLLLALIGAGAWLYQILVGMGVAGISHPVGWGTYIVNFVFWVGIGHAGTLISAILYLLRVPWRTPLYRAAETMTIFAVMTAGLFPLIHLGRVWVFYWVLPIPNTSHLWPNFKSPLVWDALAVSTYLIISLLFYYLGLIPDLATIRDEAEGRRQKLYAILALGWSHRWEQWRHYGRAYLALAALATPLVLSVHSVVSFDFAMGVVPGWHTTIFAPYFVIGAIHSGLATVLLLVIPGRKVLRLERIITVKHCERLAQMLIFTGFFMLYSYLMEPFIVWFSGDIFERQLAVWRAVGPYGWLYWLMILFNAVLPLLFAFPKIRRSIPWLVGLSIAVFLGMWIERFVIIAPSLAHDFLPSAWGFYVPSLIEVLITLGSGGFFFGLFLICIRIFPPVAISELKEDDLKEKLGAAT